MHAIEEVDPKVTCYVAAIDEPSTLRAYKSNVRWRIRQDRENSFRQAAREINESNVDIVIVQHEFGLYGIWVDEKASDGSIHSVYYDYLWSFLLEIKKPVITTLHTVLPEPSASIREAVRSIAQFSDELVVMSNTAVSILEDVYGVEKNIRVIPHGTPVIDPSGRHTFKAKMGLKDRTLISTFGLVDPRKGLEYMVEAMPDILRDHPDALYLIAGQTHPDLLRAQGEAYRNELRDLIRRLGIDEHVSFIDNYMTLREIIELLLASDVYVTPYLDPNQITSGTLSYALSAGKAIISTRYLHAIEALADGRGILVDFRNSEELSAAVNSILDDPAFKSRLEHDTYVYGRETTWPKSGRAFLDLAEEHVRSPGTRRRITGPSARRGVGT
jgi:glycosyltransferase involved in cell wall biosynthesis